MVKAQKKRISTIIKPTIGEPSSFNNVYSHKLMFGKTHDFGKSLSTWNGAQTIWKDQER